MTRLNQTPADVLQNPELQRLFLPTLRADLSLCTNYVYAEEAPLDCRITVIIGREDDDVPEQCVEDWQHYTTATVEVLSVPGEHLFIHSHAAEVSRIVARRMGVACPLHVTPN